MELKHCIINIPVLNKKEPFNGSFLIEDSKFLFWIDWNKEATVFEHLFEMEKKNAFFDVQITTDDLSKTFYSCFNCCFSSVIKDVTRYDKEGKPFKTREPQGEEKNICIACNSWIEFAHCNSLSDKCWREVSYKIDFSEPWFPSEPTNKEVMLSKNESLHFFVGINTETKLYPYCKTLNNTCQIVYNTKEKEFSIEEAIEIGLKLQTFLRYSSGIPFPPPKIEFVERFEHRSIACMYHGNYGIDGIAEYANPNQYYKMHKSMKTMCIEKVIPKWFSFFNNDDKLSAIVNFCKAQNKDFVNHQILLLTRSFDKLSQINCVHSMDKSDFKTFLDESSAFVSEKSGGIFSAERVKNILSMLNNESLKNRLIRVLNEMNDSTFTKPEDYKPVAQYLISLRNAEAHSGYSDIFKLPEGYTFNKILLIIQNANRYCIDNYVFQDRI